jgi:hypothetical protein
MPRNFASCWIISTALFGSSSWKYRVAVPLQLGDLRAYQLQAVEHAVDLGMSVRRQRSPERRMQFVKTASPVSQQRVVVSAAHCRQHSTDAVHQSHPFSEEFCPLPDEASGILVALVGDRNHRAHAWFTAKPRQQRA